MDAAPLFTEALVLIVAAAHPLAGFEELPLAAIDGLPVALLPRSFCTRRLWDTAAQSAGVQLTVRAEMNTINSLLMTVGQTSLATILPHLAIANPGDASLHIIRLCDPTPTRTVGLLRVHDSYHSAASRAFEVILHEQLAKIVAGVSRANPALATNVSGRSHSWL